MNELIFKNPSRGLSPNIAIGAGLVSYLALTVKRVENASDRGIPFMVLPGLTDIREQPVAALEWVALPMLAAGIYRKLFSPGYGVTLGNAGINTWSDWFKLTGCCIGSFAAASLWKSYLEEKYALPRRP